MQNTTPQHPKFSYSQVSKAVSELRLHPFIEMVGYDATTDYFMNQVNHFNYWEIPVITEDGCVISNPQYFLAAMELKKEEMMVTVMKGATENDAVRFVSFGNIWKHGEDRAKLIEVDKYLSNFLKKTDEGRAWAKDIPGKTRDKIATILGVSTISIQNLRAIAKKGRNAAADIDSGKKTQKQTIQIPYAKPYFRQDEKFDELEINNETIEANECLIDELLFKTKLYGEFRYVFTEEGTKLFHDGKEVEQFSSCSSGQPEQFREIVVEENGEKVTRFKKVVTGYEHLAIVPDKGQFGIHFSIRSLEHFVKEFAKAA